MRIYAIYAGETDATLNHFCFHANAVEMRLLLLLLLFGPKTRVCVCVFFDSFYFSPQGCCTINFIGFTSLYFPTYLFQSREKKTNERTYEYIRRLLTYKPKLFAHGIDKENWSPKMISISNMNTNAHDLHISRKRKRKQHKRMFDSSTVISSFSHIKCY